MSSISVYILTYNEEEKIRDALESVSWADEVIVVDSGSTDSTLNVARAHGARIVQLPFEGFGKLRNQAIAACLNEWIFSLDADERCTFEARDEILAVTRDPGDTVAYYIPRRNFFMGRWIKHCGWYPDYRQPQLFRKGALIFDDAEEVHEGFKVFGNVAYLKHAIWQMPFFNLEQLLHKTQRYSTLGALKLARRGISGSMFHALIHGLWTFFRIYVIKLGFLDGWPGFIIAFSNFEGTFYRYAKLSELQNHWLKTPDGS